MSHPNLRRCKRTPHITPDMKRVLCACTHAHRTRAPGARDTTAPTGRFEMRRSVNTPISPFCSDQEVSATSAAGVWAVRAGIMVRLFSSMLKKAAMFSTEMSALVMFEPVM